MTAAPKGLERSCWIPLACLVAVELYASNFDGWGAWATAPLFLLPAALGLAFGIAGVARSVGEWRLGALRGATLAATALALLPFAWLFVRRYFV